jgi:hypothetical protein
VQYLPDTLRVLMTSGLPPAAAIAIVLNLVLPEELSDEATEEVSGGMAGHGHGSIAQDDHVKCKSGRRPFRRRPPLGWSAPMGPDTWAL